MEEDRDEGVDIGAIEWQGCTAGDRHVFSETLPGTYTNEYNDIAEAINLACSGDTVYVHAGTYTLSESVYINKELNVYAFEDDEPIIQGNAESPVDMTSEERATISDQKGLFVLNYTLQEPVHLRGLTIRNGYNANQSSLGGCIMVDGDEEEEVTIIEDCSIQGCYSYGAGGGIYVDSNANFRLVDSVVNSNYADSNGGGVFVEDDDDTIFLITNSTISNNEAGNKGGGLYVDEEAIVTVNSSTFSGNQADSAGAAIALSEGDDSDERTIIKVINSTISENIASESGEDTSAVYIDEDATAYFIHSTIANNTSNIDSGINLDDDGYLKIFNSIISGHVTDISRHSGAKIYTYGTNVVEDGIPSEEDDHLDGTLIEQDPLLEALTDNDGDTQTHAIGINSPAYNIFSVSSCSGSICDPDGDDTDDTQTVDQRGTTRDSLADLGAYEYVIPDEEEIEAEVEEEAEEEDCSSSIGNLIWLDINTNGIQDQGEKGLENIRIKLKDDKGRVIERTDTNHNGYYKFENLCKGKYKVVVKKEDVLNYQQTYDSTGSKMNNKVSVYLKRDRNHNHTKADFGFSYK